MQKLLSVKTKNGDVELHITDDKTFEVYIESDDTNEEFEKLADAKKFYKEIVKNNGERV